MKDRLAELRRRGYNRLWQADPADPNAPGKIVEFSTPESLLELDFAAATATDPAQQRPIFVLADRLTLDPDSRSRLVDAIETGYRESGEIVFRTVPRAPTNPVISTEAATANPVLSTGGEAPKPVISTGGEAGVERPAFKQPEMLRFSAAFECDSCHRNYREPEPRLFSFNNPYGACPRCQGFGNTIDFDPDLIVPDKSKSLEAGAIDPWTKPTYRSPWQANLLRAAKLEGIRTDVPWYDLTEAQQRFLWHGRGSYSGIRGFFAELDSKKYKLHVRVFLSKYRGYAPCPECRGERLRAEARAVVLGSDTAAGTKNICEATALTITGARDFFSALTLSPSQEEIAGKILEEVRERIGFLQQVGLEYLTLDRLSSTLSGGESQRIQLASSLGSRLVGALYVLDEPSIGLHPRDTARLIGILKDLRDLGNTILVVEHDPDVIRAADRLLDMGPGAGELGGRLMAAGTVPELMDDPASLTGKYLSGKVEIPVPHHRREPGRERLILRGARANNLRGVDIEIPLGILTAVTGVSGSGKSTLIHQVLFPALLSALGTEEGTVRMPAHAFRELSGSQYLNDVILVDQSPIGRTPRSNPVTYTKAFDPIRELFASQPDARRKSFTPGSFSFNVPGGRCDVCEGDGTVTVEMQFLADIELPCEECGGTRYKSAVLEIKYKGKSIHDVLGLTVREAVSFFAGHPKIVEKLSVLDEVGLGYLRLGQSATTLSGGEAQRVKLAQHLAQARSSIASAKGNDAAKKARSRILYILDEPTTGLHFEDVSRLLAAFKKLIDGGGSLLVIEHNLDIIKCADYVIDMGPEGGSGGGQIVATGTPEQIAAVPASYTGQWLKQVLRPASPTLSA